jgi:hypothetical protein
MLAWFPKTRLVIPSSHVWHAITNYVMTTTATPTARLWIGG